MLPPKMRLLLPLLASIASIAPATVLADSPVEYFPIGKINAPQVTVLGGLTRFAVPPKVHDSYRKIVRPRKVDTFLDKSAFGFEYSAFESKKALGRTALSLLLCHSSINREKEEGMVDFKWEEKRVTKHYLPPVPDFVRHVKTVQVGGTVQGFTIWELEKDVYVLAFLPLMADNWQAKFMGASDVVPVKFRTRHGIRSRTVNVDGLPVYVFAPLLELYETISPAINAAFKGLRPKKLIVTGFSIGAGLAEMFALRQAQFPYKKINTASLEAMEIIAFAGPPVFGKAAEDAAKDAANPVHFDQYLRRNSMTYRRVIAEDYKLVAGKSDPMTIASRSKMYAHVGQPLLFARYDPPVVPGFPAKRSRVVGYIRKEEDFPSELFPKSLVPKPTKADKGMIAEKIDLIRGVQEHILGLSRMVLPMGEIVWKETNFKFWPDNE